MATIGTNLHNWQRRPLIISRSARSFVRYRNCSLSLALARSVVLINGAARKRSSPAGKAVSGVINAGSALSPGHCGEQKELQQANKWRPKAHSRRQLHCKFS